MDAYDHNYEFPSPRGVELHKPVKAVGAFVPILATFPSPRGVELHKPGDLYNLLFGFKQKFPSPRGVELHKPHRLLPDRYADTGVSFRPLAGLSCINRSTSMRMM